MLRILLTLSAIALYIDPPTAFASTLDQLGTQRDYAFALWISLLLTPSVAPWFE